MQHSPTKPKTVTPAPKNTQFVRRIIRWRRWIKRIRPFIAKKSLPEWGYTMGVASFFLGFILLFASFLSPQMAWIGLGLFYLSPFLLGGSLLLEVVFFAKKHWSNSVIRWALTISAAVVASVSLHLAHSYINAVTHVDPSNFEYVTGIFTVAFVVIVWWQIAIILMLVLTVLSIYATALPSIISTLGEAGHWLSSHWFLRAILGKRRTVSPHRSAKQEPDFILLMIGRFFGSIILGSFVLSAPQSLMASHREQISRVSTYILAEAGHNRTSDECANFTPPERIKILGDGIISVAMPDGQGGYTFETRKCLQPTSLP